MSTLLLIGMVALAMRCANSPTTIQWMVMGAYCGLGMLVNPSLMLAVFGYGPWICAVVWLAVFAPWPLRNARVLHAFIPLRSNFGYELWQGNHRGATGVFDKTLDFAGRRHSRLPGNQPHCRIEARRSTGHCALRPQSLLGYSWINNGYDIAEQHVIWARDTEPEESNQSSLCEFKDRQVGLLVPPESGFIPPPDRTAPWDPAAAKKFLPPYPALPSGGLRARQIIARPRY